MPISDETLNKEKNRFIAVKGEATVGQAIAALNALGGQPWWHLVVRMGDGSWGVARFSELTKAVSAEIHLRTLRFITASAVERDSLDTKAALTLARKSPERVLVITVNGLPIGILVEGVTRGLTVVETVHGPGPTLDQLGGKYVKLKDYGAILLGSSKK
ncbi:MAG TPA: hypothetical protein VGJ69_11715 [Pyrinomonadaceae bacterium]|jgi:hypothetical protein